jgi:cytoskeletal protein CcmA (bactofilin family)
MWKKTEDEQPQSYPSPTPTPSPAPRVGEPRRSGGRAVIGESIRVEGDIRGDEDLLIDGEVIGKVNLEKHSIVVGRGGRVKADIHGRNISVEGQVQGNLFADEQVVVRESGEVRGNITAPRVSLEDGAKFKGAIDMEPKSRDRAAASTSSEIGSGAKVETGLAGPRTAESKQTVIGGGTASSTAGGTTTTAKAGASA